MLKNTQPLGDKVAILISTVCAVHCLLIPIVVVAFPVLATTFLGDVGFHALLLWFILPTSLIALTLGCRAHRDRRVMAFGIAGLGFILLAALLGHDVLEVTAERGVTVVGSAFLILSHLRNQRLCRHDHSHDHDTITESPDLL
jgi:hypothetical protein